MLVGRAHGFDPRKVGSGNVGMTNVARAGGRSAAALTFAGDMLKGLIPILIGKAAGLAPGALACVGFAAVAGSVASIFMGFRGGRGVSTSFGVWIGLAPVAAVIALAVFLVILAIGRIVSLGSIAAAITLVPAVAATGSPRPFVLLAIAISALVLLRHHENIRRLLAGEEPKLGAGKKPAR